MRKLLLIMTLVAAVTMTACGSSDSKSADNTTKAESVDENTNSTSDDEVVSEEPEESSEEQTEEENELSLADIKGTVKDGVYENEHMGNGLSLENFPIVYDDEQLLELSGIMAGKLDKGDEVMEAIESAQMIYDLYATSEDQTVSVNVVVQKNDSLVSPTTKLFYEAQKSTIESTLEQIGGTDPKVEIDNTTFAGKDTFVLCAECTIQGLQLYERQIYVEKDGFLEAITVSSYIDDKTEDVMSGFYAID